jgi:lipopolysaccharide transport system ATP-binding protein
MSSDALALAVRGVSKRYRLKGGGATTLGEAASQWLRAPLRRRRGRDLEALADVSFELRRGEALGIVGRNGAGKSTLLKIISRVTPPTSGEVHLWGRVGSLLEVETGFHPELTGRENVYLKGAVLGMRRREIAAVFDQIVAFSGVEEFLETPVKRYSSGMRVRLGFAVAAHLRTEILLIDEVLAVGDLEFQQRCLGRMDELSRGEGRTVIFVSHQMRLIEAACTRAVHLDGGRIVRDGPVDQVVRHYENQSAGRESFRVRSDELEWCGIRNRSQLGRLRADQDLDLLLGFSTGARGMTSLHVDLAVKNERNEIVVHIRSPFVTPALDLEPHSSVDIRVRIESPHLVPGHYFLDVYAFAPGDRVVLWVENVDALIVGAGAYFGRTEMLPAVRAPVIPPYSITIERSEARSP